MLNAMAGARNMVLVRCAGVVAFCLESQPQPSPVLLYVAMEPCGCTDA